MKKGFIYLLFLFIATANFCAAQNIAWQKTIGSYNTNPNPLYRIDQPVRTCILQAGYVYTLTTNSDSILYSSLVKVDPMGNIIWTLRFDKHDTILSDARSFTFDTISKHLYVCGSYASADSGHASLIKVDTLGNITWVHHYSHSGVGFADGYSDLAVDRSGNIAVTGKSDTLARGGRSTFCLTSKIDPAGNIIWTNALGSRDVWYAFHFHGERMMIDIHDQPLIIGDVDTISVQPKMLFVMNFDSIGQKKFSWYNDFGGGGTVTQNLVSCYLLPNGKLYMMTTDMAPGFNGTTHVGTYNQIFDDSLYFRTQFTLLFSDDPYFKVIGNDSANHPFVIGFEQLGTSPTDTFISDVASFYDTLSVGHIEQWKKQYKFPNVRSTQVTTGSYFQNALYLTGNFWNNSKQYIFTMKTDVYGNIIWKAVTDTAANALVDKAYDIVNDTGALYLLSCKYTGSGFNLLLTKFSDTTSSTSMSTVWPGDANADGVANNYDLLDIGIRYGLAGPSRPNASTTWTAQSSPYGWIAYIMEQQPITQTVMATVQ